MIVADSMSEFLVNLTPADVEAERFTGRAHRELLVAHEQARVEFWRTASLSTPHEPKHRQPRKQRVAVEATYKRDPARYAALVEQRRRDKA